MIRRVFVSDIHMSPGGDHPYDWLTNAQADAFGKFLDYIDSDSSFEELVLGLEGGLEGTLLKC